MCTVRIRTYPRRVFCIVVNFKIRGAKRRILNITQSTYLTFRPVRLSVSIPVFLSGPKTRFWNFNVYMIQLEIHNGFKKYIQSRVTRFENLPLFYFSTTAHPLGTSRVVFALCRNLHHTLQLCTYTYHRNKVTSRWPHTRYVTYT